MAGMCPVPVVSTFQATPNAHVIVGSPPHAVAVMQHPAPPVIDGVGRATINMPHVNALKSDNTHVNGVIAVPLQSSLTLSSYQPGQLNCLNGLFVIVQLYQDVDGR